MPVSAGRSLALRVLGDARRTGLWVRDALRDEAERANVSDRDRALAWRLAMGATAAKGLLEERIRGFARKPSSIQPQVLDALKLAAFELLYLGTPIPVAVNEGVELVRSVAPRAANLANAILRKLASLRDEVQAARERIAASHDTEKDLLLVSALPHWLLNELAKSLTLDQLRSFCLCTLSPAPQWTAEVGEGAVDIHMDLAAQTVALLTVPPSGGSRLEIGMGRGTKTLVVAHALAEAGERAELVGVDPDARRLRWARKEFAALGYDVATYQADGRALDDIPELGRRRFDLVFLDAPCTGTGTLRRHPEIAWSLEPETLAADDPKSLVSLQAELLSAASRHVAPGGLLAYSTCSVLREENEARADAFLAGDAGGPFTPIDVRETHGYGRLPRELRDFVEGHLVDGAFRTVPAPDGPDGHFLRLLRHEWRLNLHERALSRHQRRVPGSSSTRLLATGPGMPSIRSREAS